MQLETLWEVWLFLEWFFWRKRHHIVSLMSCGLIIYYVYVSLCYVSYEFVKQVNKIHYWFRMDQKVQSDIPNLRHIAIHHFLFRLPNMVLCVLSGWDWYCGLNLVFNILLFWLFVMSFGLSPLFCILILVVLDGKFLLHYLVLFLCWW